MSEWRQIADMAETNPETLGAGTEPDYLFKYVDLSSVEEGHVRWGELQEFRFVEAPSRARRKVRPGDVLFGTVRPNLRSHGYVSEQQSGELVASTGFSVIRARAGVSDGKYLFFAVLGENIYAQSVNAAVGSNYPAVNDRDVRQFRVFAPPLRDQQKIAQILDTLDTQIRQTEALIAKLEGIKQGLLTDLLTRGIEENGQLRPTPKQAPHLYKDSPLGLIPREWRVIALGEISEIVSGVTLGGASPGLSARVVPYLRVANVQDGFLDLSEIKYIRVNSDDADKFRLRAGDVLMNEGGDYDKLGRGTVWREQIPDCIHQNHVFRVRVNQSLLLPDFLAAYSASNRGKKYFLQSSKQSTNLASINSTQLKAFPIPVAPLCEQVLIVSALSDVNTRAADERAALEKLRAQKLGMMDDLLTGRVRVTPLISQKTSNNIVPETAHGF